MLFIWSGYSVFFFFRNDSARDVHQIQEHFNVMNRIEAARRSARMENFELNISKSNGLFINALWGLIVPLVIISLSDDLLIRLKKSENDDTEKEKENIDLGEEVVRATEKNNNSEDTIPTVLKAAPVLTPTNFAGNACNKQAQLPDILTSDTTVKQGRNQVPLVSPALTMSQITVPQGMAVPVPQVSDRVFSSFKRRTGFLCGILELYFSFFGYR